MSIFPKRSVRGSSVTIHWNLTLPAGMEKAACPYVRIGIISPHGHTYILFEQHVLLLPSTAGPAPDHLQDSNSYQYLNKHTPLLVLASYLAGKQPREKLIDILNNIQNGRHYYFTWAVPPDAPPGKYTLLSEMYFEGAVRHSATVAEDLFYIEQLDCAAGTNGEVIIHNPGPEDVPVKIITYAACDHSKPEALQVFYLAAGSNHPVTITGKSVFLVYNEERITIPLHALQQQRPLRNQQLLFINKQEAGEPVSYVLPREGDDAWRLTGVQQAIWDAADGMDTVESIREKNSALYDEMIAHQLITELP